MPILRMEHTARENTADLVVQIATILLLGVLLLRSAPHGWQLSGVALVLAGLSTWTLIEYCVHRFVLHGMQPWSTWHGLHHRQPTTHVFAPTWLITALFATLVFAPILLLTGLWIACGFTLGVLCGYLLYSLTHLAIHHRVARGGWLRERQRWHAEHHGHGLLTVGRYGVTTDIWDQLFAMTGKLGRQFAAR